MTPRQQPTEPRESPRMNTSGMLKLFVYGTLKRGYWNHDAFCLGVLEIRDAQVRGPTLRGAGISTSRGPGRGHPRPRDRRPVGRRGHTGAPVRSDGSCSQPVPESATVGAWGAVYGELLSFNNPESRLPAIDRLEGFRPGRPQSLPARAGPGYGERRLRTRLGLHGRGDSHQATQDRLRPLAEVAANRPQFRSSPRRYIVSPIAPFTCRRI